MNELVLFRLVPYVVTLLLFTSLKASAEGADKGIEGAWTGTVTAVQPPLGSFDDLISFFPKGNVIESRRLYVADLPTGSLLEMPAHGEWLEVKRGVFQVNLIFLLQGGPDNPNARGASLGTDNIGLRLELSEDGMRLRGTFRSDVKDPSGNILLTTTGTYAATRFRATP